MPVILRAASGADVPRKYTDASYFRRSIIKMINTLVEDVWSLGTYATDLKII